MAAHRVEFGQHGRFGVTACLQSGVESGTAGTYDDGIKLTDHGSLLQISGLASQKRSIACRFIKAAMLVLKQ
jgi:hypothetical protein